MCAACGLATVSSAVRNMRLELEQALPRAESESGRLRGASPALFLPSPEGRLPGGRRVIHEAATSDRERNLPCAVTLKPCYLEGRRGSCTDCGVSQGGPSAPSEKSPRVPVCPPHAFWAVPMPLSRPIGRINRVVALIISQTGDRKSHSAFTHGSPFAHQLL